jgi:hypothetical protein
MCFARLDQQQLVRISSDSGRKRTAIPTQSRQRTRWERIEILGEHDLTPVTMLRTLQKHHPIGCDFLQFIFSANQPTQCSIATCGIGQDWRVVDDILWIWKLLETYKDSDSSKLLIPRAGDGVKTNDFWEESLPGKPPKSGQ